MPSSTRSFCACCRLGPRSAAWPESWLRRWSGAWHTPAPPRMRLCSSGRPWSPRGGHPRSWPRLSTWATGPVTEIGGGRFRPSRRTRPLALLLRGNPGAGLHGWLQRWRWGCGPVSLAHCGTGLDPWGGTVRPKVRGTWLPSVIRCGAPPRRRVSRLLRRRSPRNFRNGPSLIRSSPMRRGDVPSRSTSRSGAAVGSGWKPTLRTVSGTGSRIRACVTCPFGLRGKCRPLLLLRRCWHGHWVGAYPRVGPSTPMLAVEPGLVGAGAVGAPPQRDFAQTGLVTRPLRAKRARPPAGMGSSQGTAVPSKNRRECSMDARPTCLPNVRPIRSSGPTWMPPHSRDWPA